MKIEDYKIGNIYKDTNGKSFVLDLHGFTRMVAHYFAADECYYDPVQIRLTQIKGFRIQSKKRQ